MSVTIYVPCDSAALSLGANEVADAVVREAGSRNLDVQLVRNGSRGMLWLETMLEVATDAGRIAYGPVTEGDVASLFDADVMAGGEHALRLGKTEDLPWMQKQTRLTFSRVGVTDPVSTEDYTENGGCEGLKKAVAMAPADIVEAVVESGLRGRGGAGFPAGIKWRTVLGAEADQKYIACKIRDANVTCRRSGGGMRCRTAIDIEQVTVLVARLHEPTHTCRILCEQATHVVIYTGEMRYIGDRAADCGGVLGVGHLGIQCAWPQEIVMSLCFHW